MYYYNLRVYFAIYYVLQRTFLAIIFQILLIVYFPLVRLMLLMKEREENWGGGGGESGVELCSFQGKSMKNMMAFAPLTYIAHL